MAHKLTVFRGTSFTFRLFYERDGSPASLADATVRFTVKTAEWDTDDDDSGAILAIDVTSHVDEPGGETLIELEPDDTAELTPAEYHWDVRVEHDNGDIFVLDSGIFNLEGRPTNRIAP